ncbi:MAG: hypothetical protein NTV86_04365 [Planctomycetota bacterium]|nr:hypothetical protein [Planctomycetota bacterium]
MNGRERLTAVLNRRRPDRLAWTTLVDGNTLGALGGEWAGLDAIGFGRRLGADLLLLDGWGTARGFASPALVRATAVTESWQDVAGRNVQTLRCPAGELTAVFERGHPRKYPVETLTDLRVLLAIWEGARYQARDDGENFAALDALVAADGVVTRFWGPSTIPRLLEFEMGTAAFYYLLNDHPDEMGTLIDAMHRAEMGAFEALAAGPCQTVILVENTSSFYISPDVYARFNGPHVADFVDSIHRAGKTAILHMCGHVKQLLPQIARTGADGVHALTEPPFGDTPWELALDALGEDCVIIGALNPNTFLRGPVDAIGEALDALYTPRLRRANVCCCAFADGLPVSIERWLAIAQWFERNGGEPEFVCRIR